MYRLLDIVAREGLAGVAVREGSLPYDVADITALLRTRVIYPVLGALIEAGKLGVRPGSEEPAAVESGVAPRKTPSVSPSR